jgi:hypothetical protein
MGEAGPEFGDEFGVVGDEAEGRGAEGEVGREKSSGRITGRIALRIGIASLGYRGILVFAQ